MNIVLIGYRACGKTSAGRALAERMRRPFLDTDALIQERTGKTIRELVAAGGWPAFRDAERACIREIARRDGLVISLGGGAVLDRRNVTDLKRRGLFFWLTADAATIRRRLEQDPESGGQRPSLSGGDAGEEIDSILRQRTPIYRGIADGVVDTTRLTIPEVAAAIMVLATEIGVKIHPRDLP
ncbi:MAG: shikimate kinase [Pseudomonadota bacterium]|nr:shikimate kinase [Pseudomonadota bacterium]